MITLSASGGSVTFTFSGNSTYLNDGQITVPVNSLALIIDESDMATFRKAASNDIFVSANIAEFGMTKAELESWFKENAVGSTGGGGDITSGEVQTMIDESISGKVNVSDNIVSAHTFNASSSYGSYITKLRFYGRHFYFNDFHSKKISVFPFGGLNGQLFTSLYVEGPNYTSYDGAAYLSGSTNNDYPSSFTSVTWIGDETKMKVEINSEGYLDLIAQGDYWFGVIDSNVTHELYVNILNDIASGQSASVINDSIVNNLENLGNTINGIQYEINRKLDATAYTPVQVSTAITENDTNAVAGGAVYDKVHVTSGNGSTTLLTFGSEIIPGTGIISAATNYQSGVTKFNIELDLTQWGKYDPALGFYDSNNNIYAGQIINTDGVITYTDVSDEMFGTSMSATTSYTNNVFTIEVTSLSGDAPSGLTMFGLANIKPVVNAYAVEGESVEYWIKDYVDAKVAELLALINNS